MILALRRRAVPLHISDLPVRVFTNDVIVNWADVIQEMVRGLFPIGHRPDTKTSHFVKARGVWLRLPAIKQRVFGEEDCRFLFERI